MNPLIHIPLYCWPKAPDYAMRAMVEQHLTSLESYFALENTYDVLVTTNDRRPLEIFSAYKEKSGHRFDLRFVTPADLLSVFQTDQKRLNNIPCVRTIMSKFYPILSRERDAIVHVDFDTMFTSKLDLAPLFVSDIGLVDANQFMAEPQRWQPTESQAEFFRLPAEVKPRWNWINSGVFSVQRRGFEILAGEISHYLENLDRAVADGTHVHTDEIIMNALAIREAEAVAVIPDHRYNFLAYFLKHDPEWTTHAQIVHFHSLKPDKFWYVDGALTHRCDEVQAQRVNDDLYRAVLMWFRHFHAACRDLPYLFPLLKAIPEDVVERELVLLSSKCD
ncbi:MAG TPA: hypothetical protein VFT02_15510 [Pyrinomonadaceae bacterium]|nr:hypothetical protein [Pyrinomonadaceae bacterium]